MELQNLLTDEQLELMKTTLVDIETLRTLLDCFSSDNITEQQQAFNGEVTLNQLRDNANLVANNLAEINTFLEEAKVLNMVFVEGTVRRILTHLTISQQEVRVLKTFRLNEVILAWKHSCKAGYSRDYISWLYDNQYIERVSYDDWFVMPYVD